jgi:hypothetical protein
MTLRVILPFAQQRTDMKTPRAAVFLSIAYLMLSGAHAQEKDRWNTPATPEQTAGFISRFGDRAMIIVPETREHPLRFLDAPPAAWMDRTPENPSRFEASPRPGEYFVFQIGVYAPHQRLKNVLELCEGFAGPNGQRIPAGSITCFNMGGIGFDGRAFTKTVNVEKGRVQPLWFGVQIPREAKGRFRGVITLSARDVQPQVVTISLDVQGTVIANGGVDEGNRLARLQWLNSTIGTDTRVTKGYEPIMRTGNILQILGRKITVGRNGLPESIFSYFNGSNQALLPTGRDVLRSPIKFVIETADGRVLNLRPGDITFTRGAPGLLEWQVMSRGSGLSLVCTAHAEFDGFVDYHVALKSEKELSLRDVRLEIPMNPEMAGYCMGMGQQGGFRPDTIRWKWDVANRNQDMVWVGGINGGLRLKLKAENYGRPLINVYYKFGTLNLPPSWGNAGKGGADIVSRGNNVLIRAFSGERIVRAGDQLNFDFELLVTPFRLVNRNVQFNDRYYHTYKDVSADYLKEAAFYGANIINIHHKSDINPFINYPYLDRNVPFLKEFVDSAHARNLRVKLYYTTRELTVNVPEFWALRSLNGEVIFPGPGNATRTVIHPNEVPRWLVENLKENYIPAWVSDFSEGRYKGIQDVAVITTPDSRWNNFYLEGLNWMVKNIGIDGMYVDDSALDRKTLQRARKILDDHRPDARIDLHSWNHFCEPAGWTNCLNLYMDMLPYFDLVWIGEMRNYDMPPDHWLIEVSGIPFGLSGQMLADGGNKWRGMVYGITNRLGWVGPSPDPIWKFWDEFRIQQKEMLGYWDARNPVRCSSDSVKVTVYRGGNQTILALGNWGTTDQTVKLEVNYARLGLSKVPALFLMPEVKEFQAGGEMSSLDSVRIPGREGRLIVFDNH